MLSATATRAASADSARGAHGAGASAHAPVAKVQAARAAREKKPSAESIGAPNSGKLRGAVRLRTSGDVLVRQGAESWGLPDLVHLLQRAAGDVVRHHGGGPVFVGDLSAKNGGPLVGHNSHQTGRDADVAFYAVNSKGKPVRTKRFVAFDGAGRARDVPWLAFDDARNWAFVRALLEDKHASVRYVFVTNELRARLLAYGRKKNAPAELLERAAAVMMSPADADVHDDHFHVRIACPESMRGECAEESIARGRPARDRSTVEASGDDRPGTDDADEGAAAAARASLTGAPDRAAEPAAAGDTPAPAAPSRADPPPSGAP